MHTSELIDTWHPHDCKKCLSRQRTWRCGLETDHQHNWLSWHAQEVTVNLSTYHGANNYTPVITGHVVCSVRNIRIFNSWHSRTSYQLWTTEYSPRVYAWYATRWRQTNIAAVSLQIAIEKKLIWTFMQKAFEKIELKFYPRSWLLILKHQTYGVTLQFFP